MSHESDPRHDPRPARGHTSKPNDAPQNETTSRHRTKNGPGGRGNARMRLGAEGERRAAWFLRRRGYRILAHNVRFAGVELDLIAQRGQVVVFIEVKTRRSTRFGAPELAVDMAKQARIVRGAAGWLRAHPGAAGRIRFDVVSCHVTNDAGRETWRIEQIADAFHAGDD